MSVPSYRRKESPTEFIKELYELNIRCGQIVMSKPTKYRQNYGDFLIQQCLRALDCAQEANSIYVSASTDEMLMKRRIMLFHEAIQVCGNIPTTATIFLELVKEADGYKEKCTKAEIYFADKCYKISSLLKSVIKSDEKRYKEYKLK